MTTRVFVKHLTVTLKKVFSSRFGATRFFVRKQKSSNNTIKVEAYQNKIRDLEAEKTLALYVRMYGLAPVNPNWYYPPLRLALEAGTDSLIEPLRLAGTLTHHDEHKIRALIISGVEICFSEKPDGSSNDTAIFRGINLSGADLSRINLVAHHLSSEKIKLQADFRGARPIIALIKCLKAIDLHESLFDEEQLSAICALAERDSLGGQSENEHDSADSACAKSIVYNPLCSGKFLLRLEQLAHNRAFSAVMLCGATTIPPDTAKRFAALVDDASLDLALDTARLNPHIRPFLASRRIKRGPSTWQHLAPGSIVIQQAMSNQGLDERFTWNTEFLAEFALSTGHDTDTPVVDEFPRDAFSDHSCWRHLRDVHTCALRLYWHYDTRRPVAFIVANGERVLASLENPLSVFGKLLPVLLVTRAQKKDRERTELLGKMIALTENNALLRAAARELAHEISE